jgi:hypothetical protein
MKTSSEGVYVRKIKRKLRELGKRISELATKPILV